MLKPMVYIAGPISKGPYWVNCRNGVDLGYKLLKAGYAPFVPMMDFLMVFAYNDITWEDNLQYDEAIIMRCDAMIRMPGESLGADRETRFAFDNDIPVFHSFEELENWKKNVYGQKESKCCGQYS